MSHEILNTLLDAVEASPNNGPLRCYLAETLLYHQRWVSAANQYLAALHLEDVSIEKARFGLAKALLCLDKPTEGLELVESLLDSNLTISRWPVHLLHARYLHYLGKTSLAVGEYIRAIDGDPALADNELAIALGLQLPKFDVDEATGSTEESQVSKQQPKGKDKDKGTDVAQPDDVQPPLSADIDEQPSNPPSKPISESEVSKLLDDLDSWIANPWVDSTLPENHPDNNTWDAPDGQDKSNSEPDQ